MTTAKGYTPLDAKVQTMAEVENELEPKPNVAFPLKGNTYDAVWFTIARGEHNAGQWISLAMSIFVHLLAEVLQLVMIFGLLAFTIGRREDQYEIGDLVSRTHALYDAVATDKEMDKTAHAQTLGLCKSDHNIPYTQSVVVWIWGVKVLPILSQGLWKLIILKRLPTSEFGKESVAKEGDKLSIVRLPFCLKLVLFFLVDMPRSFVAVFMYFMGAKFLMFAPSLGTLILKCVGLAFISQIPDILLAGLYSEEFQKELGKVQIRF